MIGLSRKRRMPHGDSPRRRVVGFVVLGLIIGGLLAIAFGRNAIVGGGTPIRAVFVSGNQLKPGSAVRIAGLDVGRVTGVQPAADGRALVTMSLDGDAPPIHVDARLAIRPRLAFEGNFYVDVSPGTAGTARLRAGDTVPRQQTSVPVQLDQVMSTLTAPVRGAATSAVGALASGLGTGSGAGIEARAGTGVAGLRRANRELSRALSSAGRVSRAAQGTDPGDLTRALAGAGELTSALARDPAALREIVTSYNGFFATLADNDRNLAAGLGAADDLLRVAPGSLDKLDAQLPRIRTFATALNPVLRDLPQTQRSFSRALAQFATLVRRDELPRLVGALEQPVRALPGVLEQLRFLMPLVTPIGQCIDRRVMPVLRSKLQDGPHTIDQPVWQEFLHMAASLTGASSDFDANGTTIRAGLATGDNVVHQLVPGIGDTISQLTNGATGVRPAWLGYGVEPPMRPDQPCARQPQVDLRAAAAPRYTGAGDWVAKNPLATMSPAQQRVGINRDIESVRRALAPARRSGR
ncbi:MlaD family protein [Patulibacter medicamentivorans]|uniref:MlaD family protein n=1 Tax=Patulibacter medicamentivorans TaxID=1097667 RepID=UPI0002F3FE55|nr:MlaD family protein [Patulibacter medicamentivorans]